MKLKTQSLLETEDLSSESSKENSMLLHLFEFHCQKEICERMFLVDGLLDLSHLSVVALKSVRNPFYPQKGLRTRHKKASTNSSKCYEVQIMLDINYT